MFILENYRSQLTSRASRYVRRLLTWVRSLHASTGSASSSRQPLSAATTWDREEANRRTEHIIDTYGNSILRLAYSYIHNLTDAEDLLQEVLIRYLRSAPSFESAEHEKAWLLRVTINLSKNKIKFNQRRHTSELIDADFYTEAESDLKIVWEAVKSLPSAYAEVLHLFYQEGYPTEQIASLLSKKESTVRSLLHRGRAKLKAVLKEEYDFAE
ncbi:RNA polymerase sigma factor [Saccharibacillus sacchari]|uniref:Sigma-70 family RNA polymerase sigma factor n=1 Tax=Saccharibacillus sacchari TaxID=456493 RepID=A0ACC6PE26_9BACL